MITRAPTGLATDKMPVVARGAGSGMARGAGGSTASTLGASGVDGPADSAMMIAISAAEPNAPATARSSLRPLLGRRNDDDGTDGRNGMVGRIKSASP